MLIGLIGKTNSGRTTITKIIQAVNLYRTYFEDLNIITLNAFIHKCLSDKYTQLLSDKNYNSKYERHAFSDKMKLCVSVLTDIDYYELSNPEILETYSGVGDTTSYKELIELVNDSFTSNIDSNIWIKLLFKNYDSNCNWIIPDVKYESQANAVVKKGGILIRLSGCEILSSYPSIAEEISNNTTMDDLIDKVLVIINKYKI